MIIGIRGKIRSGKDAIAARLVDRFGFTVVRFSDALKEELLERMPTLLRYLHDQNCFPNCREYYACVRRMVYDTKPPGIRELEQEYGTQVRRADDPDYWTKQWAERAKAHSRIVAPDVRFFNEARAVLNAGGVLWQIHRPGTANGTHSSETIMDAWTEWDAEIHNDGDLAALWDKVDALMSETVEHDIVPPTCEARS